MFTPVRFDNAPIVNGVGYMFCPLLGGSLGVTIFKSIAHHTRETQSANLVWAGVEQRAIHGWRVVNYSHAACLAPVVAPDFRLKIWRLLRMAPALGLDVSLPQGPSIEAFFMLACPAVWRKCYDHSVVKEHLGRFDDLAGAFCPGLLVK